MGLFGATPTSVTKRPPNRALNLAQQAATIRRSFPAFAVTVKASHLLAVGVVAPSSISAKYRVRVVYEWNRSPSVAIEDPRLERRPEMPETAIPHTYQATEIGKEIPCIYRPGIDWNVSMPIGDTIIPWLLCWLVDYEYWRATGDWLGGGAHPAVTRGKLPPWAKQISRS